MLQRNGKLYGPKNALNDESSCWNSDAGETQHYTLDFGKTVTVQEIRLQFQAGFTASFCHVETFAAPSGGGGDDEESGWKRCEELEPEDSLELQSFELETNLETQKLRLVFEDFTDFYGRITLYQVQVWGQEGSS